MQKVLALDKQIANRRLSTKYVVVFFSGPWKSSMDLNPTFFRRQSVTFLVRQYQWTRFIYLRRILLFQSRIKTTVNSRAQDATIIIFR